MKETVIIAEAGINHDGSVERAKLLIDAAKSAKADMIKFQTFITELNVAKDSTKAEYQIRNTDCNESQFEMVKRLELSKEQFLVLKKYCDEVEIEFLSTAFDIPSIDFLCPLQPVFKVPSGEITNYPYLKRLSQLNKKIYLSTGMSTMSEISDAIDILTTGALMLKDITVLHCNTEYPTPMKDVNLKAMNTIKNELGVSVGYSDHTLGIEVPIAAVALGARVLEKHLTLDRGLSGPDHNASIEPEQFKSMVDAIRNIDKAMSGDGKKRPSKSEEKNIPIVRKSIHSRHKLSRGDILKEEDMVCLRPGTGISPMEWEELIGKEITTDIDAREKIQRESIK